MSVPNNFSANTIIDPDQVNDNFDYITDFVDLVDGHLRFLPDSNKVEKHRMILQAGDGSNTYTDDVITMAGWGYKLGIEATEMVLALVYGVTFSTPPIPLITPLGLLDGSNPGSIGDFNSAEPVAISIAAINITTTGCDLHFAKSNNFNTARRYGFSFEVKGVLA